MAEEVTVTFNEEYVLNDDMVVGEITRHVIPPRTINTQEIPLQGGEQFVNVKDDTLEISIEVTIDAPDYEAFQEKLDAIGEKLGSDQPKRLQFSDERGFYMAILTGNTEYAQGRPLGEVTLTFLCPRPYRYGEEQTQTLTGSGGVINREGRKKVSPVFDVTFQEATDRFRIRKASTGEQIIVEYDFTADSVMTIDAGKREIDIDGDARHDRFSIEETTFFKLDKETELDIPSAGVDSVDVRYRGRW